MYDYFSKNQLFVQRHRHRCCATQHINTLIHENVQTSPVYLLLLYLFVCKFVGQPKTFMAFMCGEG